MIAKEKAEELVNKFYNEVRYYQEAKEMALIAVDEILKVCSSEISNCSDKTFFYYEDVKNEIQKL